MQKFLIALGALSLFAAICSPAMAQPNDWHTYAGAGYQFGSASYKGAGSAVLPKTFPQGFQVHVGERFGTYYAVELGYMQSQETKKGIALTVPYSSKVTIGGPTLDAYGYLPLFHGPISLVGTAGASYLKGKARVETAAGYVTTSDREWGYRFGGGVEWRASKNFGARVLVRYQSADFKGVAKHAILSGVDFNVYF